MESSIVLGIDDQGLQEEILHFLDRQPGVSIVAFADTPGAVGRAARQHRADAVVGVPQLLGRTEATTYAVVLRETTDALRTAIRVGARGFYVWPRERDALAREVARSGRAVDGPPRARGPVVALLGARGGAGTTFLATNLTAAIARRGVDAVLGDLDLASADVAPALGIAAGQQAASIEDLASVAPEITAEHLDRVLVEHPEGFRVLLAPPAAPAPGMLNAAKTADVIRALQGRFEATLLHLPRVVDASVRAALEVADRILLVATLDVLGIRAATRMVDRLRAVGVTDRVRLVVNRGGRGEIVATDAEIVLGIPLEAVLADDAAVERAQNRGELVVGRRRNLSRHLDRLARRLVGEAAA